MNAEVLDAGTETMARNAIERILRSSKHIDAAEDALQTTKLKVLLHASKFRAESAYSTWVTRIAINEALMHRRKSSVRHECLSLEDFAVETWLPDSAPNPEEQCMASERSALLHKAIAKLTPALRQTVLDYLAERRGGRGAALSITEKTRLFRAYRRLRKMLRGKL